MPKKGSKTRQNLDNSLLSDTHAELNANINSLVRKRDNLKTKLLRFGQFLNSLKTSQPSSSRLVELDTRLKDLESHLFSEYNDVQFELEGIDFDQYKEQDEYSFETLYYETISDAKHYIFSFSNSLHGQSQNSSVPASSTRSVNAKLPTIELPKFFGSYEKWLEFKELFVSLVHNVEYLDSVQKFHYLRASLEGPAAQCIQHIGIVGSNYELAWNILCERFDNKRLIIHNNIKSLVNVPELKSYSPAAHRNLVDTLSKNLRSLEAVGIDTDSWDPLIIFLVTSKFDVEAIREWEKYETSADLPTISELKSFLSARADFLEKVNMHKNKTEKPKENHFNLGNKIRARCYSTSTESKDESSKLKQNNFACFYCKNPHPIYKCQDFLALSIKDRTSKIQSLKLCLNCLQKGHDSNHCRYGPCRQCSKKHNSLLHPNFSDKNHVSASNILTSDQDQASTLELNSTQGNQNQESTTSCNVSCYDQVLLATALVEVSDNQGRTHVYRALLDSGSMSNFISEPLAFKLNLPQEGVDISVSGINQTQAHVSKSCNVQLKSIHSNFKENLHCLILPKITDNIPSVSIDPKSLDIPSYIKLADPQFYKRGKIDIIIGAGTFWKLLCKGTKQLGIDKPVLQKSKLGWYISGPIGKNNSSATLSATSCCFTKNLDVQSQLAKFWEIEEVSSKSPWSDEENQAELHFQQTFRRNDNGRFVVSVPLKEPVSRLGDSKQSATKQFFSLEKRFASNPKLKEMYTDFMAEYDELNHMSSCIPSNDQVTFFSPHHGVLREDNLTTKLRVVFNSSCPSSSGLSYNSLQRVGPTVQEDLLSILIRFRQHKFVISADICKMYRQILIEDKFKPLQLILWRSSPEQELKIFSLNTVVYGTASAPFLATRCLYQLSLDNQISHPEASEAIRRDFYVDDLLSGASSVEEAIKLCDQINAILAPAGFELRKWRSNCPEILSGIKNLRSSTDTYYFGPSDECKTLGMLWSSTNDNLLFRFHVADSTKKVTKRVILSETAKIFDPLGLISPVIVRSKILLQQLWLLKLSWDDEVPIDLANKWKSFMSELSQLNSVYIRRQVVCKDPVKTELHGFSDASQNAYGACIYIRTVDTFQNVCVQLLISKTRVAPLKSISIPRLELCAALLLSQLFTKVISSLTCKFDNTFLWCDSTIVLAWIRSSPHLFQVFVANRVSEIQTLTLPEAWRYIPTDQNPADLLSRGMSPSSLLNSNIWFNGPNWLRKSSSFWPKDITKNNSISSIEPPEMRKNIHCFTEVQHNELFPFSKFSSFTRIKRVMAYILRFVSNCKSSKEKRNLGPITIEELRNADNKLVMIAQQESFSKEIQELTKCGFVSNKSHILSLTPFLEEGIIRVGGRLKNSNFSFEKKHPALLSPKHPLTYLIFRFEHAKLLHCGPQLLLSSIRESFWPISGKNLAKRIVKECILCFRFKPKLLSPIMGDLPEPRVSPRPPFSNVGIDYAGPFQYKDRKGRGSKTLKCYLCLFICLTVKAVHLELVTDLSTSAFLEAFQRFIARRGKPSDVYSDNGSNFVGANNQLKDLGHFLNANKSNFKEQLGNALEIKWHFIPAYSPHQGGIWEAGIKSAKHHLNRLLNSSNGSLTFESFYTVITQIENILNSRPLTPLSTDPNDLGVLTPSHFLINRSSQSLPYPDLDTTPMNRLSHYEHLEKLKQQFWKRWSNEYVTQLQQRLKWKVNQRNLSVGEMVLIRDSDLPPFKWRIGRVDAVHPGPDGTVRVVSIRTASGLIKRAVVNLAPLPIDSKT